MQRPWTTAQKPPKRQTLYDGYYNRFFLSGLFNKSYPADVMDGLGPHMPKGWQDDFDQIAQPIDWLGLNYYTRKIIAPDDGPWPHHHDVPGPLPKTQVGWEIFPEGLYAFLKLVHEGYTRACRCMSPKMGWL